MKYILANLLLCISLALNAQNEVVEKNAVDQTWSIAGVLTTFGPGVFVQYSLKQDLFLKAEANYFLYKYSLQKLIRELDGDARIQTGGVGVYCNWYFWKILYLAPGISTNFTAVKVNGQMAESIWIGDIEMYPEEVGRVDIKINPSWPVSPYLGIGCANRLFKSNNLGFVFEIGSYLQGAPDVHLAATGMLGPTASKEQEMIIEENIKPIDFWPKVTLGITYKLDFK